MGLKNFFGGRIKNEKDKIKRNKDGFAAIGILEGFMVGATALGLLSGIFTIPTLMAMSLPTIVGVKTMVGLRKSIKDSKEKIEHLETLQKNGVDASRNHERHLKLNELKEEKEQVDKKDDLYTKLMIGGVGAFILGGFVPLSIPLAATLMYTGYGTMLYGMYKENKTSNKLREYQKEIDKTSDAITAGNLKQKFIMSEEKINNTSELKKDNSKENTKSYSTEKEQAVDQYIEDLANQDYHEDINNKVR